MAPHFCVTVAVTRSRGYPEDVSLGGHCRRDPGGVWGLGVRGPALRWLSAVIHTAPRLPAPWGHTAGVWSSPHPPSLPRCARLGHQAREGGSAGLRAQPGHILFASGPPVPSRAPLSWRLLEDPVMTAKGWGPVFGAGRGHRVALSVSLQCTRVLRGHASCWPGSWCLFGCPWLLSVSSPERPLGLSCTHGMDSPALSPVCLPRPGLSPGTALALGALGGSVLGPGPVAGGQVCGCPGGTRHDIQVL